MMRLLYYFYWFTLRLILTENNIYLPKIVKMNQSYDFLGVSF